MVNHTNNMKSNTYNFTSYLYLSLPLMIFVIGFLKPYIGIPFALFAAYAVWSAYKKAGDMSVISINLRSHVYLAIAALALCYLSGVGAFYTQTGDYLVKNALLRDLCDTSWPMIMDLSKQPDNIQDIIGSDKVAFVYYLFFYLPAAVCGKIGGEMVARIVFLLWSAIGLYLMFVGTANYILKEKESRMKKVLCFLLLFFLFGGLDIIGALRTVNFHDKYDLFIRYPITGFCETWCMPYFRLWGAHIHDLSFVFNQCIPAWLMTILIMRRTNNSSLFFIYSFTLLYSPWAAIGLFPIVGLLWLFDNAKGFMSKTEFFSTFSLPNFIFPILLLVIVGGYYASNASSTGTQGWFFSFMTIGQFIVYYPLFIIIEIGIYLLLLWKQIKVNKTLMFSFIILLLLPFYHITPGNDLLMRAAIPALYIVFVYWAKYVLDYWYKKKVLLATVLFFTSFSSTHTIIESITPIIKEKQIRIIDPIVSFHSIQSPEHADMCDFQFFAHNYKDSFFFKYLAK